MNLTTYQLIIVKTAMTSSDYVKINQLLKQIQGEKYTSNIYKVPTAKSEAIIKYLEQEQLNYEIYWKNGKDSEDTINIINSKENVKEQILELKKEKLLKALQEFYIKKGIKRSSINPNIERQIEIKNSPDFYQQAPFLTIAEDLLKLIKEDKVESLIFLSAYDKKRFVWGDERKRKIFRETFSNLSKFTEVGKSVIDDNPNICNSLIASMGSSADCLRNGGCIACDEEIKVLAPYYPAVEKEHHKEVLLVKNEVSNLKKEDFENLQATGGNPNDWHCNNCGLLIKECDCGDNMLPNDKRIPDQAKQELARLGATKPFYADNEEERSIKFKKNDELDKLECELSVLDFHQSREISDLFAKKLTLEEEIKEQELLIKELTIRAERGEEDAEIHFKALTKTSKE
ncbi:5940_t:CDS:2 [Ambispora gerdemannii]|uniref:5940_t:CDS:1 n=1 Tax=Ambispora gerdemannii TaxID=144530 RepID=A0A9N8UYZ7_9GLOM|nr:5940_t:CDS:2 [Ambispora gerdemannii]